MLHVRPSLLNTKAYDACNTGDLSSVFANEFSYRITDVHILPAHPGSEVVDGAELGCEGLSAQVCAPNSRRRNNMSDGDRCTVWCGIEVRVVWSLFGVCACYSPPQKKKKTNVEYEDGGSR